jgi:hypothetical protein
MSGQRANCRVSPVLAPRPWPVSGRIAGGSRFIADLVPGGRTKSANFTSSAVRGGDIEVRETRPAGPAPEVDRPDRPRRGHDSSTRNPAARGGSRRPPMRAEPHSAPSRRISLARQPSLLRARIPGLSLASPQSRAMGRPRCDACACQRRPALLSSASATRLGSAADYRFDRSASKKPASTRCMSLVKRAPDRSDGAETRVRTGARTRGRPPRSREQGTAPLLVRPAALS